MPRMAIRPMLEGCGVLAVAVSTFAITHPLQGMDWAVIVSIVLVIAWAVRQEGRITTLSKAIEVSSAANTTALQSLATNTSASVVQLSARIEAINRDTREDVHDIRDDIKTLLEDRRRRDR